MPAWVNL
jgi:hypothetical protein